MDDEFSDLEAELRNLRAAPVGHELLGRIALDLDPVRAEDTAPESRSRSRRKGENPAWLPWLALPIAAAIALALVLPRQAAESLAAAKADVTPVTQRAVAAPAFKPVAAQNILVSSRDDGDVTLADGTRARRIRQSYVDTITWKNPRTQASLTWSVPREEVRVIPVSYE